MCARSMPLRTAGPMGKSSCPLRCQLTGGWIGGSGDIEGVELLTVGDVAKQCQVSRKTVTRAILSGRLCASRLGARGAYRIRPEDVDRWVEASVIRPVAAPAVATPRRGRLRLEPGDGRLR